MIVSSTQPQSYSAATDPNAVRTPKKTLGQEDFLKLMTVQLIKQDPMKPVDDTSFIAQMAQFSSLEQASAMAKDMASLRTNTSLQSASSLLGKQVTFSTDAGQVGGVVDSVDSSGSTVKLGVGNYYYPLSQVVGVAPGSPAVKL